MVAFRVNTKLAIIKFLLALRALNHPGKPTRCC